MVSSYPDQRVNFGLVLGVHVLAGEGGGAREKTRFTCLLNLVTSLEDPMMDG